MSTRPSYRRRSGERGQVLPLMAGGLVALLLFVGLVIDTGVAFQSRRAAQNVSDLSAMAGTRIIAQGYLDPSLTLSGADVYNAIESSAEINGCPDPCGWTAQYVHPTGSGWTNRSPHRSPTPSSTASSRPARRCLRSGTWPNSSG